jgi:hypothetical protein
VNEKRPYIAAIILIASLAAAVFLWQILAVPGFTERERILRGENAVYEKDAAEIEAMKGNSEELEKKLRDAENRINEKYSGRSETTATIAGHIIALCGAAGVEDVKIDVGKSQILSPAGKFVPALNTAEITILFEGMDNKGSVVIRNLENSRTADIEITAFIYRYIPPVPAEEEGEESGDMAPGRGEWLVAAKIYYYE